jgi:hypothetical protein
MLERAGIPVENWDTRAALLWVLVACERFAAVEASLERLLDEVHRSGSARGFVAAYSTLGLLKLRLGALPEADAAARIALRVLQEGDFAPGLAFAATVSLMLRSSRRVRGRPSTACLAAADWVASRCGHGPHSVNSGTSAAGAGPRGRGKHGDERR